MVLILLLVTASFAVAGEATIKVVLNAITLKVNGERVAGENLSYQGTTYVPLRQVAEMLGKEVRWEKETKTADIVEGEVHETKKQAHPVATMTMKDKSIIKIELYPEKAPNTVNHFIALAQSGFYDGLTFHRIIKDFVAQGGDPKGDGTGGPGYAIRGEFLKNEVQNDLLHERGIVSMARVKAYNSAGSQFFVVYQKAPHLNGEYAAFGKVIENMDAIDKWADLQTDENNKPTNPPQIESITISLNGYEAKVPEKIK